MRAEVRDYFLAVAAAAVVLLAALGLALGADLRVGTAIGATTILVGALGLMVAYRRFRLSERRYGWERDRRTRVPVQPIAEVDPTQIGIDPAAESSLGKSIIPTYVPREVDAALRGAVETGFSGFGPWIVVATGSSKVGKSRTLFEALRQSVMADQVEFFAPVDGPALRWLLESGGEQSGGSRGAILWLDDLEPFLSQGITLQTLREWHERVGVGIVAATYGGKGSDLVRGSSSRSLATIAAEVLEHAREIQMRGTTARELDPLRAELPSDDLSAIEEHGLAAYLVAAPALVRKLVVARHGPDEDECPEGVALTYAAIDWARCGRRDPIPEEALLKLWPSYLRAELRASDSGFQRGLQWALRGVAGTIGLLLRQPDGYRAYDYIVQYVENGPGPSPHEVAWARAIEGAGEAQALAVGTSAYLHGSYSNALTAFKIASGSSTSEVASPALFNLGVTLGELDRAEEALAVFDEVVQRFGEDPASAEQTAAAMINRGVALTQLDRGSDAIAAYDRALALFGDATEPAVLEQVARGLVSKGMALAELREAEFAIAAYDEVLRRFDDTDTRGMREQVALALLQKGMTLDDTDLPEDAVAAYDAVIARFGHVDDVALERIVARAMGSKGVSLAGLGRQEEAVLAYEEIVARHGGAADIELQRSAAHARYSIGLTLATLGEEEQAIAVFDHVAAIYSDAGDPEIRELAERAQTGKSLALGTLRRSSDLRLGDPEVLDRVNVAAEERLEADFERNLRVPVHVTELGLSGIDVFDETSWYLRPGVNVLLGRNGYGKSLLLRILAGMLQRQKDVTGSLFEATSPEGRIELGLVRDGRAEKIERDRKVFLRGSLGKVPLLAIPDARFMDRSSTTVGEPAELNLAREGASHYLGQNPYQSAVEGLLGGLAYDYLEHDGSFDLPTFSLIKEVMGRLAPGAFEFSWIERVGRTGSRIWVRTEGLDRDIEIQRASQGTLSVITIFGLIHAFLLELAKIRGQGAEAAREQEAIVVVDEVDAHLHPVWQQKIRNALAETFPRVQFLLTAHSPLIVAGCGPNEVSVLRKVKAGYGVQQLHKDFVGSSARELYAEVFDVEDLDENFREYSAMVATGRAEDQERELDELLEKGDGDLSEEEGDRIERLLRDRRRIARVEEVERSREPDEVKATEQEAEIVRLEETVRKLQAEQA